MNIFKWFKKKRLVFNIEDCDPAPVKRSFKYEITGNYRIKKHIIGSTDMYSLEAEMITQTLENDVIVESGKNWYGVSGSNIVHVYSYLGFKVNPLYFDTEKEAIDYKE